MLLSPERRTSRLDAEIVAAYLVGTSGGAILTALLAWVLSGFAAALPATARVALLALGTVFVWMVKHGPLASLLRLPENRRQIPSTVLTGSLPAGALRFGFEMGTGVRTYLPTMAPYVLLLALLVIRPTLGEALAAALGFAVGRTVPLAVRLFASPASQRAFALGRGEALAGTAAGLLVFAGAAFLV